MKLLKRTFNISMVVYFLDNLIQILIFRILKLCFNERIYDVLVVIIIKL